MQIRALRRASQPTSAIPGTKKMAPFPGPYKEAREEGKNQGRRCKTPFRANAERSDWTCRDSWKRVKNILVAASFVAKQRSTSEAKAAPDVAYWREKRKAVVVLQLTFLNRAISTASLGTMRHRVPRNRVLAYHFYAGRCRFWAVRSCSSMTFSLFSSAL